MLPVFLSYRRAPWQTEVLKLSAALKRYGLRTVVDVSDPEIVSGQYQFDALRRTIRDECSGLVLYASREVSESSTIWHVEIPAGLEALDQRTYMFMPVFRDVSPDEFRELPPHGRRIAALGGHVMLVGPTPDDALLLQQHQECAIEVLKCKLAQEISEQASVSLRTRQGGVSVGRTDLVLDWTADFDAGFQVGRPAENVWSALQSVSQVLAERSISKIEVRGPAHLSAAIAVGYAFHRAKGFQLVADQRGALWSASGPGEPRPLRITGRQLSPGSPDLGLILAISRPEIKQSAEASLPTGIGGVVTVDPEEGAHRESIGGEGVARYVVDEVVSALMKFRSEWRTLGRTHVFISAPFALSVLLGHSLNGFGPLTLYERSTEEMNYRPALDIA